jgi:hypothetical protein
MRVDRQVETARRDIRAEMLSILSNGGLLEFELGRLCTSARGGLGHRASRRLGDRGFVCWIVFSRR